MNNDERHIRKFRKILQEKGIRGEVVIDDSDVSCDVRKGNCKLLLDKYELDCKNSKVTQKNINIKEPVGLPERMKNAKKNAGLCKDGRLDYIKSCCRSKTDEHALATDMGHLIQIVKMQKLEDFLENELERKAEERRERDAERREREAEERREREAERLEREAEERKRKAEERKRKAELEREAKQRDAEERRLLKEAEKERKQREAEERVREAEREAEIKRQISEARMSEESKFSTEIANKITRFLIRNNYKITDINQVLKLCKAACNRVLNITENFESLIEVEIVLNILKIQLSEIIKTDDDYTAVVGFLGTFIIKKIRSRR
jgi:flagellar biosynthesis GTPase FlhF